jgi:hypothetical protein
MSKIPQREWSAIAARHAQGESLSAIARSYGCTPPAIHYVLKRNGQQAVEKVEQPAEAAPSRSSELRREAHPPTLRSNGEIKLSPNRTNELASTSDREPALPAIGLAGSEQQTVAIGLARSEQQTTAIGLARSEQQTAAIGLARSEQQTTAIGLARSEQQTAAIGPARSEQQTTAIGLARSEQQPAAEPQRPIGSSRTTGRALAFTDGLDSELYERAEAAIETFRSCFGAALAEGSPHERARLRQAASDLMRVAARTTIVLDRLNAPSERAAARFDPGSNGNRRT